MMRVSFLKTHLMYQRGEVAGFAEDVALGLIAAGVAVVVADDGLGHSAAGDNDPAEHDAPIKRLATRALQLGIAQRQLDDMEAELHRREDQLAARKADLDALEAALEASAATITGLSDAMPPSLEGALPVAPEGQEAEAVLSEPAAPADQQSASAEAALPKQGRR